MNIFDAPKGNLDLTIAPKQVTNDKANLEATRSKQELAFRALPSDTDLAQQNRESKRRLQAVTTPESIQKKSIEDTPLSGGEGQNADFRGTGFSINPVLLERGWQPDITAHKLAVAFLPQVYKHANSLETSKESGLPGMATKWLGKTLKGAPEAVSNAAKAAPKMTMGAAPKITPTTTLGHVGNRALGAAVGHETGTNVGIAADENLLIGRPTNTNDYRSAANLGGWAGAVLGARTGSRWMRPSVGAAYAGVSAGQRYATDNKETLGNVLNQTPSRITEAVTGKPGYSVTDIGRMGLKGVTGTQFDAFDVLENPEEVAEMVNSGEATFGGNAQNAQDMIGRAEDTFNSLAGNAASQPTAQPNPPASAAPHTHKDYQATPTPGHVDGPPAPPPPPTHDPVPGQEFINQAGELYDAYGRPLYDATASGVGQLSDMAGNNLLGLFDLLRQRAQRIKTVLPGENQGLNGIAGSNTE